MKTRSGRFSEGFTIIEVLIAMGILSFIVAAIYSSWSAVLRSTRVGMEAAAQAQRTRIAGQAVEQALKTAVMFGENIRYYSFVADTSSEYPAISLTSRLPLSFPGSGLFGDQTVRRVSFEVVPGTNNTRNLVLSQLPFLLSTNETVQPYHIVLARDVSLFFFEFWDEKDGWVEEYTLTNQLPKLVRFSVGIGHAGISQKDPAELIVRTVSIPAAVVAIDMQRPQPGGAPGLPGGLGGPGLRVPGVNLQNPNQPGPGIDRRGIQPGGQGGPGGTRNIPLPPGGSSRTLRPGR